MIKQERDETQANALADAMIAALPPDAEAYLIATAASGVMISAFIAIADAGGAPGEISARALMKTIIDEMRATFDEYARDKRETRQ